MRQVYLDHSATTPLSPEVFRVMEPFYKSKFGNPSSVHSYGQEVRAAIERAREQTASALGAEPAEIVFTSGGTEANNFALTGAALSLYSQGNHIITNKTEHHSILQTCNYLEKHGYIVTYLPVDEYGQIDPNLVEKAITRKTILISIMHANNEVGTINPIEIIGFIAKKRGILFHTDAVQTLGKIPINVHEMPVDVLSISGHKIYGPKGVGAVYIQQGINIEPLIHGGSQERNRRAGTENVPAVIGFGEAVSLSKTRMVSDTLKLANLTAYFYSELTKKIDGIVVNGHPSNRIPGILNLNFEGVYTESLLLNLNLSGIAVSNGSACSSGSMEPSHVLLAMGYGLEKARSAVRFSLGQGTTKEDCDYVTETLPEIVCRLRSVLVKL
ncbi:MAG: cysteine desulfurase [Patescibacteria group bacterium]|nr:cysteine desulfurase [Patescibacteria group bacterium]